MNKEQILELLLKNPELINEDIIAKAANKYKTPLYAIGKYILNIYKDLIQSEFYSVRAVDYKNWYDSLIAVGFTDSQAMAILLKDSKQELNQILTNMNQSIQNLNK